MQTGSNNLLQIYSIYPILQQYIVSTIQFLTIAKYDIINLLRINAGQLLFVDLF